MAYRTPLVPAHFLNQRGALIIGETAGLHDMAKYRPSATGVEALYPLYTSTMPSVPEFIMGYLKVCESVNPGVDKHVGDGAVLPRSQYAYFPPSSMRAAPLNLRK